MSELVSSGDVNDTSVEQGMVLESETARTTLSDIRCDNDSLNATSIVDQESNHRGLDPLDERGVARMYPLSDVGCERDALNVNIDVAGEIPRHPDPGSADTRQVASSPRDNDIISNDSSSDVDSDVSSSLEQITFDGGIYQRDMKHIACPVSQSDDDYQLYTLVNGVTGAFDGTISLEDTPSLSYF